MRGLFRGISCAPQGETAKDFGLMRLIDQQVRDTPFNAVGQTPRRPQSDGRTVNQHRIRRLMRPGEWFRVRYPAHECRIRGRMRPREQERTGQLENGILENSAEKIRRARQECLSSPCKSLEAGTAARIGLQPFATRCGKSRFCLIY